MLSYRHAFHAGNHADVLKHFVLFEVLRYFNAKEKPYWFIDTHAGAGRYDLRTREAAQNAEYRAGVGRLWDRSDLPAALQAFVALLRGFNPGQGLRTYPGSPALAHALMPDGHGMRLFERHPAEYAALRALFRTAGRRVQCSAQDGFAGLIGLLPPPTRRAVVLIDPPYEVKDDYRRVEEVLGQALKRFASGTYLLWYPLLPRREVDRLRARLPRLSAPAWLRAELVVQHPARAGHGMYGSGVYVINPPWTLPETLQTALPALRDGLALDAGAAFSLDACIP